jgi:hypothetical protein
MSYYTVIHQGSKALFSSINTSGHIQQGKADGKKERGTLGSNFISPCFGLDVCAHLWI